MANEYEYLKQLGYSDEAIFNDPNMSKLEIATLYGQKIQSKAAGVGPQFLSGLAEGVTGLAGMAADLNPSDPNLLASKTSLAPWKAGFWPRLNEMQRLTEPVLAHAPANEKEKAARIVGQFAVPDPFRKIEGGGKILKALLGEAPKNVLAGLGAYYTDEISPLLGALLGGTAGNIAESGYNYASKTGARRSALQKLEKVGVNLEELNRSVPPKGTGLEGKRTTAELTKNPALAQLEQGLAETPELHPLYVGANNDRSALRDALMNDSRPNTGLNNVAIGDTVRAAGRTERDAMADIAGDLFESIDPQNMTLIPVPGAMEGADAITRKLYTDLGLQAPRDVGNLVTALKDTPSTAKLLSIEGKSTQQQPFGKLQGLRSTALTAGRETSSVKAAKAFGTIAEAIDGAVTKAVENNQTKFTPEQLSRWKEARKIWNEYNQLFTKNPAGKKLVNPQIASERLVGKVWDGTKQTAQTLKRVLSKSPEAMAAFKDGVYNLIPRDKDGIVTTYKLASFLEKNAEGLREFYGAENLNKLQRVLADKRSAESVQDLALQASKRQSKTVQSLLLQKYLGGGLMEKGLEFLQGVNPAKRNELLFRALLDPDKMTELLNARTAMDLSGPLQKMIKDDARYAAIFGATSQPD